MYSQEKVRVESDDLEFVVKTVTSRVKTYDVQVNPEHIRFFFFHSDNPDIAEAFDDIRKVLVDRGYIPFIAEDGEAFIEVDRRPQVRYRSNTVNLVMLILTLASTIYVGSGYASAFVSPGPYREELSLLYGFAFFSAPLMLILGIHEIGHYIVAKRHHVRASLPFFIPFPLELGTFGAFISLRDPIPNKRAMTEIGAAGPIFGFLTALPLMFLASYLSRVFRPVTDYVPFIIHLPLIYHLFHLQVPTARPIFPMVLAVWVGMFATAMNLIPVGQLDGGHVIRGLLGRNAVYADYAFVAILFYLGIRYPGWWLLAIFVIFMGITHPPALDDYSPIRPRDIAIGVFALVMFVLTFTVVPISQA